MKLSRTVSYAVQASLQLAEFSTKDPVPCSRIATEGNMPERFLLQILRSLVNHGILHSTRGVDGGYSLERTPDEVSLLEVIEAIDGPVATVIPASDGLPEESRRRLTEAVHRVTNSTRQQLEEIKMSQLMASSKSSKSLGDSPASAPPPHFKKSPPSIVTPRPENSNPLNNT